MSRKKDLQGRMKDATGQPGRDVPRYARRFGWNVMGLPDHGAINDVLARIIGIVERKGMHLGRWGGHFTATYAAFVGKCRPRSYSRHGFLWVDTKESGGVTIDSTACLDLLDYERRLRAMPDADWDALRNEAVAAKRPRRKGKDDTQVMADAAVGPVTDATPCGKLRYCPYGSLVEQFPIAKSGDGRRCARFGHVCPAFVVAGRASQARDGFDAADGAANATA